MTPQEKLRALFQELLAEVSRNDELRDRVTAILVGEGSDDQGLRKRSARRKPGRFDPMAVYRERPNDLTTKLDELTLEELKDIVAENGMDRSKLAMKWKAKDRLIDLIVSSVKSRAQKGDAFRGGYTPESREGQDSGPSADGH